MGRAALVTSTDTGMTLVTGATRFLENFVVQALGDASHEARALVRSGTEIPQPMMESMVYGDFFDRTVLCRGMAGAHTVAQLADRTQTAEWHRAERMNVQ